MTTSEKQGKDADGGNEMFYLDDDGKRQDAKLHEAMLDNPAADLKFRALAYDNALANGMSQEDADNIFGPAGA